MGYKDENVLGLIKNISEFLNTILFTGINVSVEDYEKFEELLDFKGILKKNIEDKKFQDAEKKIFEEIEKRNGSHDILRVGYWFFLKLNTIDEKILKEDDYSKEDILRGMRKLEEYVMGGF